MGSRFGASVTCAILLAGCSSARVGASDTGAPTVTFPAHFAEGHGEPEPDAGAPAHAATEDLAKPASDGTMPDPDPPLSSAVQWDYALHYSKGEVTVTGVTRVVLPSPVVTPRKMGRFAIELTLGRELVERVRFDFPLLAADLPPEGKKHPLKGPPRFAPGADTSAVVRVPESDRATAATLVDRLTGKRTPLAYPPTPTPAPPEAGAHP
ncbi:MAG TPA: hypothetical protein VHE30_04645 [Polyangiaceae bacterium]|nr:hypothetical protein [Polyangiaceae bacterium]